MLLIEVCRTCGQYLEYHRTTTALHGTQLNPDVFQLETHVDYVLVTIDNETQGQQDGLVGKMLVM